MFKNVGSQKAIFFAFDSTTNLPKTGDAGNITGYVSKDYGSVTVLGDTSATEMDSTNAKGYYLFDLTQGETNGDTLLFSAKSSTSNIVVIGVPGTVFTAPANFTTMSVDGSGRVDLIKIAGTTQTARDIGTSVLLSSGTGTGQLSLSSGLVTLAGVTHTGARIPAVTLTDTVTTYTGNTVQTGDAYARVGAPAGASISADIAAVKTDTAAVKTQTDKLAFTVANQIDANVLDWKGSTAPAMTGDAYARLGAPAGASVSADVAAVKVDTAAVKTQTDKLVFTVANQVDSNVIDWKGSTAPAMTGDAFARLGAPAGASVSADIAAVKTDTAAVPTATQNADALLKRDWTSVSGEAARSVLNALRFLRNKWSVAAGTLTVTKEDDSTSAWTGSVSTDAAALPITGNDPA